MIRHHLDYWIIVKMLKADLCKKKAITLLLFFFITIAAFLVASSTNMMVELINSLNYMLSRANVPHFVQMNNGAIDPSTINRWASKNNLIYKNQIVNMLRIDRSNVFIGQHDISEKNSIMNIDFVTQNDSFDFLFNLNGQIIHPARGEVAVSIYYMQRDHLKVGDKIRILTANGQKEFIIVDFVRDALMNPSIIHSKRFLINSYDFIDLKKNRIQPGNCSPRTSSRAQQGISRTWKATTMDLPRCARDDVRPVTQLVYLIEFQLRNLNKLNQFSNEYLSSNLPQKGPIIHYQLYRIINSITDGFTIGLITIISILLTIVALLSLRFTILTTMEEDYKEIGIMRAIGVQQNAIRKFYLAKYVFVATLACSTGYLAAIFFKNLFISNIMLYLGRAPKGALLELIPLFSVCVIFLIVLISCLLVLKKFTKISAVEALRAGIMEQLQKRPKYISLKYCRYFNLNIFLGLRDVLQSWNKFILLFFVFFACSFILVLPINFFNTIKSPSFMTFIGIGRSDMRIDMQQENAEVFNRILEYLKNDTEVKKYSAMIASRFQLITSTGQIENINIESGDISLFPIHYLSGRAPANINEISLSYLNSKELEKKVGDHINVLIKSHVKELLVSGIYQDVTNGGRTAKSLLPSNPGTILWYVFNVDFKPTVAFSDKVSAYANLFPQVRVTNVNDYLMQTLGGLIKQIKVLAILIVSMAMFVTVMISSLFLKLLIAKHYSQIAIMKTIGFSLKDIRTQYLTRTLLILNLGIVVGVGISNTIGEGLAGLVWSWMGAPEIKFITNVLQSYVICPLLLMSVVAMTTIASATFIKKFHIEKMSLE